MNENTSKRGPGDLLLGCLPSGGIEEVTFLSAAETNLVRMKIEFLQRFNLTFFPGSSGNILYTVIPRYDRAIFVVERCDYTLTIILQ